MLNWTSCTVIRSRVCRFELLSHCDAAPCILFLSYSFLVNSPSLFSSSPFAFPPIRFSLLTICACAFVCVCLPLFVSEWPWPEGMSSDARSLCEGLIKLSPKERLGSNGAAEIKAHPFFKGIDFDKLRARHITPPFVPDRDYVNAKFLESASAGFLNEPPVTVNDFAYFDYNRPMVFQEEIMRVAHVSRRVFFFPICVVLLKLFLLNILSASRALFVFFLFVSLTTSHIASFPPDTGQGPPPGYHSSRNKGQEDQLNVATAIPHLDSFSFFYYFLLYLNTVPHLAFPFWNFNC